MVTDMDMKRRGLGVFLLIQFIIIIIIIKFFKKEKF